MGKAKRPNIDRLRDKGAVRPLAEALHHEDIVVRLDAGAALNRMRRIGWEPKDDYERALLAITKPDWPGLTALGELVVPLLLEWFVELASHPDDHGWDHKVSERIARAIGAIGDPSAVEPLISILERGLYAFGTRHGWRVNLGADYAAVALGMIGDAKAVEPLLRCLEGELASKTAKTSPTPKGAPSDASVEIAIEALVSILERSLTEVSTEQLEFMAGLDVSALGKLIPGAEGVPQETVERVFNGTKRLVDLAKGELASRGS